MTAALLTKYNLFMQDTKKAGVFSVVVMFMLTFLGIFSIVAVSRPSNYELCGNNGPALWVSANFYFSTFGGLIGAVYELYLVMIGKIFEVDTIPVVPRIRGFNAGYIFTVGLIFDVFMVFGERNPSTLNALVFFLAIIGTIMAPGLAFPKSKGEKAGQAFFGGMTMLSMLLIFIKGTAYGGLSARILLGVNKFLSAGGAILTPPNKSLQHNIQFHILRFIANIMLLVAFLKAQNEFSCFTENAQALISETFLPTVAVSVVSGWVLQFFFISKIANVDESASDNDYTDMA